MQVINLNGLIAHKDLPIFLDAQHDGFFRLLNRGMRCGWQVHAQAKTRYDVKADEDKKYKQKHHHVDHGDQFDTSFVTLVGFDAVEHG